jgi:hypothetical protein
MDRLPPQLDPHGELIFPGEAAINGLDLAGVDTHHRLGLDEDTTGRSRGLGGASPDLDVQATLTSGLEPVEAGLVEVDSGGLAVDPGRRVAELVL